MNLSVVRWLLANNGVLLEISKIMQGWSSSLSSAAKLEIVYKIGLAIIPAVESFPVVASASASDEAGEESETKVMCQQLSMVGIDWATFQDVLLPLIIAILKVLIANKHE